MNAAIRPDLQETLAYRGDASHAALSVSLLADVETPISAFHKLRGGRPGSLLLESVEGGELMGRYSFMACGLQQRIELREGVLIHGGPQGEVRQEGGDLLAALRARLQDWRPWSPVALPRFHGGAVGYVGFDCVRAFDGVPLPDDPGLGLPEALLLLADEVYAYDHLAHRLIAVVHVPLDGDRAAAWHRGQARLQDAIARLSSAAAPPPWPLQRAPADLSGLEIRVNRDARDMQDAVRKAREAIVAGEVFQVVIGQRLTVPARVEAFALYRALRSLNPSPYMFFFDFGSFCLVGASPEVLVRLEGDELLVRPIAGTRRRGRDEAEDTALEAELRADDKELAEHRMLVDLGRNDLGRVAAIGSVQVQRALHVERYSHVMHLVSDVRARLAAGQDAFDVLRACFPAGTVSGAPKIRALELIAALEPDRRGPYAGAVGYFAAGGDMDTAIAIRTLVVEPDAVHVQAGAGVVYDSVPEREHEECWHKAGACLQAVALTLSREEGA